MVPKPVPSEHPNPTTQIGSKMGGAPTNQNGTPGTGGLTWETKKSREWRTSTPAPHQCGWPSCLPFSLLIGRNWLSYHWQVLLQFTHRKNGIPRKGTFTLGDLTEAVTNVPGEFPATSRLPGLKGSGAHLATSNCPIWLWVKNGSPFWNPSKWV